MQSHIIDVSNEGCGEGYMSEKSKKQKAKHKLNKSNNIAISNIKEKSLYVLPDFELIIGNDNNEILNGDVQVQWCISDALISTMLDNTIIDPHILLVSYSAVSNKEMSRQLVPLTQLKTYVRCTKSGEVRMHAWIISADRGRKAMRNRFTRLVGGTYDTDLIYLTDGTHRPLLRDMVIHTVSDIDIPAGVFGKEPGPRMKKFVNMWHSSKLTDECNYRQRKLLAFTIKWELMILYAIFALGVRSAIAFAVTLCGYSKSVEWTYVWRVFDFSVSDVIVTGKYTQWFVDNDYIPNIRFTDRRNETTLSSHRIPIFTFALLIPMVQLLLVFLVYLICNAPDLGSSIILTLSLLETLAYILVAVDVICELVVFLLFVQPAWIMSVIRFIGNLLDLSDFSIKLCKYIGWGMCVIVILLTGWVFWAYTKWILLTLGLIVLGWAAIAAALYVVYKLFTIDPASNDITDIRELVCEECEEFERPIRVVVPRRKRTISLWYLETKNKVCKPMQS